MNNLYYSQFPTGFSKLVTEILPKVTDGKVDKIGDDFILWESNLSPAQISKLDFVEVSYLVINYFEKDFKILQQIDWINKNKAKLVSIIHNIDIFKKSSFRVVVSQVGKHSSIYNSDMAKMEKQLSSAIKINRGQPDYELRLIEKKDYGFIGVRVSKTREYIDDFQVNSVRREVAYYMNYLSEPHKNDVFIDPMCGGGMIPILRSKMGGYKKIVACDSRMNNFRSKLRILRKQGIQFSNFEEYECGIKEVTNRIKYKVNKIVVDPPWGVMQKVKDLDKFYQDMFKVFESICDKDATIVLLVNNEQLIIDNVTDKFEVRGAYKGLVSGREANICKLTVNK